MRKKRVLYIIEELSCGGAERVVVELALRLDRRRFEPLVCCLRREGELAGELRSAGVPVFEMRKRGAIDLRMLARLCRAIRRLDIDVVHTHLFTGNAWGRLAAWMAGVPRVVASEHSADEGRDGLRLLVDRMLAPRTDTVIAKADAVAGFLKRRVGVNGVRVKVVPNGVDVFRYSPHSGGREEVRRKMGVAKDSVLVVTVGRLAPEKDHENFLRALKFASADAPRIEAWIVGEGPLEEKLKSRAREIGVDGIVKFLGRRDDVPRILAAADVFALSSRREGMPLSLLEAMATGLAVVVTDAGGCAEIVKDGRNGLLVPRARPRELARAMARLANDAALRAEMGRSARKTVEEEFSLEKAVRATEQIYLRKG